jgi:hypothetical protein
LSSPFKSPTIMRQLATELADKSMCLYRPTDAVSDADSKIPPKTFLQMYDLKFGKTTPVYCKTLSWNYSFHILFNARSLPKLRSKPAVIFLYGDNL